MNIPRPRHSVLNLFDPLLSSSPPQDSLDADSDKENANSPPNDLSFSAYFNRSDKYAHPTQHIPKKRLVDIGDMTIDDASFHQMLTTGVDDDDEEEGDIEVDFAQDSSPGGDDDANETLTFRDMAKAATPNWKSRKTPAPSLQSSPACPRTPLADLPVEQDSTPMARMKVYRRQPPVPIPSKLSHPESELDSPTRNGDVPSSLDYVISAVNLSGISFADAKPLERVAEDSHPASEEQKMHQSPSSATNLSVDSSSNSLGNSVSTLQLLTPVESLIVESTIPLLISPPSPTSSESVMPPVESSRLRPNPPDTSRDSNRHSIDLHTSFQLQLQSSETTFDLLNDKVSFFNSRNGMDSFLSALEEDDSFNMELEKESMEIMLKTIKKDATSTESPISETASESDDIKHAAVISPVDSDIRSPTSPMFISGLKKKVNHSISSASPVFFKKADAPVADPVFLPSIISPPTSTPGSSRDDPRQPPPPPMPALRIVKRAKALGHEKSNSTDSTSSLGGSSVTAGGIVPPDAQEPVAIPRVTSQPARRAGNLAQSTRSKMNTVRVPSSFAVPVHPSGVGPRRVLISEGALATNKDIGSVEKTAGFSSGVGPRRVPVAPASVANTKMPAPSVTKASAPSASGLKPPARYGNTTSSLPKPVAKSGISRLPAPGFRKAAGGDGTINSRSIPVRRVA